MSTSDLLRRVEARRSLPPPAMRKAIREGAGVSQRDMAEALTASVASIHRWETGECTPRGAALVAYAELLAALASRPAA